MNTHVIANFTVVAVGTSTIELVNCLVNQIGPTSTTVLAGVTLAADQFHRTVFAAVFWLACAKVIRSAVRACSVFAGIVSFALINFVLAVIAFVTFIAFASITTDTIHASAWSARVAVAFVDIHLAILAGNTLHAEAFVSIEIFRSLVS